MKFFWYLFMGAFYVLLSCFILYSALIGMGTFLCAHYPLCAVYGYKAVGIWAFVISLALFVGGSYLHCYVRDKYFKHEEGGVDDVDN